MARYVLGTGVSAKDPPTAAAESSAQGSTPGVGGSSLRTVLAIRNARVYVSPHEPVLDGVTVVVRDGKILAVGEDLSIPAGAQILPGEGRVVTAGFWNAHVHFTEPKWANIRRASSGVLNAQLRDMLTSRGFTTVVDTGSDPRVTMRLRRRNESEQLSGPTIYTAGLSVFPPNGIPYYLRNDLPFWVRPWIPQPSSPASAARIAARNFARGADILKLFTGSYVARGKIKNMPEEIARAAAQAAHSEGRLVFSHPSNFEGVRVALRAGVDVLAHPPDTTVGVDDSILRYAADHKICMTPTLKMFAETASSNPEYLDPIYALVRKFHGMGGVLLFGTDVGYLHDYSTLEEFQALGRCGLDGWSILRMLTTAPAHRFGVGDSTGTVTVGCRADLVLLDSDPIQDIGAFSQVRATIRGGLVTYLRS
jgi:imidazolonepropionase-like amidohydrolase